MAVVVSRDQLHSITFQDIEGMLVGVHTPARTLVKSSILVPESGSVGVSAADENVRKNCCCHDRQLSLVAKLRSMMSIIVAQRPSGLSCKIRERRWSIILREEAPK
jgi:hypothetical protein